MLHFPGAQASPEPTLIQQEIVFVLLLLLISAVAIVVRRVRLPYTVALALVMREAKQLADEQQLTV